MNPHQSAGREPCQRLSGDSGANLVEYSMLIALIVVVCLAALQTFGSKANSKMSCNASAIATAANATASVRC